MRQWKNTGLGVLGSREILPLIISLFIYKMSSDVLRDYPLTPTRPKHLLVKESCGAKVVQAGAQVTLLYCRTYITRKPGVEYQSWSLEAVGSQEVPFDDGGEL